MGYQTYCSDEIGAPQGYLKVGFALMNESFVVACLVKIGRFGGSKPRLEEAYCTIDDATCFKTKNKTVIRYLFETLRTKL